MAKQKHLVIGNWKLYIQDEAQGKKLAQALRRKARQFGGVEVAVAVPSALLGAVAGALKGSSIAVGAQHVSPYVDEKRTGEVSAALLKSAGAKLVIVGHSERRAMGESEESIALEAQAAVGAGLTVVLCVGEKARDAAGGHFGVIATQLREGLRHIKNVGAHLVIAYEPVWAIGKTAADAMKPEEAEESVIFIRKTLAEILPRTAALKVPILYGGSTEPTNARDLIEKGGVGGFLVGHASVDVDSFLAIIQACKS